MTKGGRKLSLCAPARIYNLILPIFSFAGMKTFIRLNVAECIIAAPGTTTTPLTLVYIGQNLAAQETPVVDVDSPLGERDPKLLLRSPEILLLLPSCREKVHSLEELLRVSHFRPAHLLSFLNHHTGASTSEGLPTGRGSSLDGGHVTPQLTFSHL